MRKLSLILTGLDEQPMRIEGDLGGMPVAEFLAVVCRHSTEFKVILKEAIRLSDERAN